MLWEARVLAKRELREEGDLDDATREELSDPSLPPDPLVPVGYEPRDTRASLTMLGGNIVVNLAMAGAVGAMSKFVFNAAHREHRRHQVVAARGDGRLGLPLLLGPPVDARDPAALGEPRHAPLQ